MIDTDKYTELMIDDWLKAHQWEVMHSYCNLVKRNESLRFELDGKHEDGLKWIKKCEELDAEVKRLREQFKLAYDWVDTQFPDGGMADFAEYIGDEEE